jgi:hypothetical protein
VYNICQMLYTRAAPQRRRELGEGSWGIKPPVFLLPNFFWRLGSGGWGIKPPGLKTYLFSAEDSLASLHGHNFLILKTR